MATLAWESHAMYAMWQVSAFKARKETKEMSGNTKTALSDTPDRVKTDGTIDLYRAWSPPGKSPEGSTSQQL
jgi:hypothetical protein